MTITLYSKPACHLCDAALLDLDALRTRYPHTLEVVDITSDPLLLKQYGEKIPVVKIGRREYGAPLTREILERALADAD